YCLCICLLFTKKICTFAKIESNDEKYKDKTMKMTKTLLALALMATAMGMSSCCDDNMGTTSQPETVIDFEQMKESAVQEFLNYAKVPRPGYQLDKARAYLKAVADENGWKWERDEYGSCWIDVPATKGYEHFPNVILQGHMDMVCASAEGETHDYYNEVGIPVREGDLLRGEHINLGVDNGIGVGMMMAIIKSDAGHGPIRCLFTADEDQGMEGAESLAATTINANYLISLDGEGKAEVLKSSSGGGNIRISNSFERASTVEGQKKITVIIKGLRGGHSGLDIGDHRLSAIVMGIKILSTISTAHGLALIGFDSGIADNAIANKATLEIAVNSTEVETVKSEIQTVVDDFAKEYPEENIVFEANISEITAEDYVCESSVTPKLVGLLNGLKYGPVEFSKTYPNHVATSCNISPLLLKDGEFAVISLYRSDFMDWLDSQETYYSNLADEWGFDFKLLASYPAWFSETEYPMVTMLKKHFSEALGFPVKDSMTHGGLEPGYFLRLNPNLQITCLGPQIDNAHSINETLHIEDIKPLLVAVVKTIQNLDKVE
ncbi:MAG: M20/M25/M40 family metallo-hydrolase, partial [Bacteroidales bacterium]|nr:M20/M25/M40 family metallo-hydrolase [Candidatus Physcousia equi]